MRKGPWMILSAPKGPAPRFGEFYTKIGTFPTVDEEVRISLLTWKLPKACYIFFVFFFPWLNSETYIYHSVIFLVSKFYFDMFAKLYIASQNLV